MKVLPAVAVMLWLMSISVGAQTSDPLLYCSVCGQRIWGTVYVHTNPYLQGKRGICETCAQIKEACSICYLPVKQRFKDLKDGRFLCEQDAKTAVLTIETAETLFESVKRGIITTFARNGRLPEDIKLFLVDRPNMETVRRVQRFPHPIHSTVGLTRTRAKSENEFTHEIYILDGLRPSHFTAVAAHEYTHAWMQENVSTDRMLDTDAVEGFCELIAYRLMEQRKEPIEMSLILSNDYTRGQIHTFLNIDPSRLYETVRWIRFGTDQKLEATNISRVFVLARQETAAPPAWSIPPPVITRGPDTLKLRSISGPAAKRLAMINNQTFAVNEQGKVRVGDSNVLVRCVEILDASVVIQVEGSSERRVLQLGK